jgi:CHASE2 domain-containing sensor protein/signal transduction histidine kinase
MLVEWWSVLLTASLAILALNWLSPPVRIDNLIYDFVLRMAPPRASDRILIVAIDNRSLAELGRFPWPRDIHARLIDRLAGARPVAIGYDVLFPEPSAEDAVLARAIAGAGNVVLPQEIEIPGPDGAASRFLPPVDPIGGAGRAIAHVVTRPDRDGVVRGIDRLTDGEGRRILHMGEALAALAEGDLATLDRSRPASGATILAPARDLIPFVRGPGAYPEASFADVLAGRLPANFLEGRIVLVGATAAGLGDRFSTPMSGKLETMAGVELHANYVDSLLADRLVHPVEPVVWQIFSLAPMWLLMLSLRLLGPRINLWLGLALAQAIFLVTLAALAIFEVWLPPATALIAIGIIFPLWGWRRLDIASRYMLAELRDLRAEQGALPRPRREVAGDPVERQMILMHEAIADVRDLRRFVGQSLDSLPDAALVTDLSGRVLIANGAAETLFRPRVGRPLEGVSLDAVFRSLDPDPRLPDIRARQLVAQFEAGTLAPDAGYETRLADGTSLEIRLAIFTDADRRPLGTIARFADITRLRASERQREDALRLLTHDMRAPQASILAILEAEGRKVPRDLARRLERYAHQTLSLADDFVHLARAESGRFVVETFNLADAMLDAVDDLWPLAEAKRIRIASRVPETEALVVGDRALVTRAITNLIGNAIKYSPDGTRIEAVTRQEAGEQLVEIIDQGRGIAEADLGKLFEPFQRLAPPEGESAAAAPGAGLGLAFVKAVVERHQGRVTAASVEGEGSTFAIWLPAA